VILRHFGLFGVDGAGVNAKPPRAKDVAVKVPFKRRFFFKTLFISVHSCSLLLKSVKKCYFQKARIEQGMDGLANS
jgi:hypothetical protein